MLKKWTLKKKFPRFSFFSTKLVLNWSPHNAVSHSAAFSFPQKTAISGDPLYIKKKCSRWLPSQFKKKSLRRGIEPRPPGWKESMLTITLSELVEIWRSRRTANFTARCFYIKRWFSKRGCVIIVYHRSLCSMQKSTRCKIASKQKSARCKISTMSKNFSNCE